MAQGVTIPDRGCGCQACIAYWSSPEGLAVDAWLRGKSPAKPPI